MDEKGHVDDMDKDDEHISTCPGQEYLLELFSFFKLTIDQIGVCRC